MGILELHFHDSRFEWTVNPGSDEERSLSLGLGGESDQSVTDGGRSRGSGRSRPSILPKLKMFGALALVVGAAAAFNRIQNRRVEKMREAEAEESSGRLSLGRS